MKTIEIAMNTPTIKSSKQWNKSEWEIEKRRTNLNHFDRFCFDYASCFLWIFKMENSESLQSNARQKTHKRISEECSSEFNDIANFWTVRASTFIFLTKCVAESIWNWLQLSRGNNWSHSVLLFPIICCVRFRVN